MVNEPGDWQWSSYLGTIGKQDGFEGLSTDALLLQFGQQRNLAIEGFQTFISQGKYTMNEIAEYFGCHYSTVSRVLAKCKS